VKVENGEGGKDRKGRVELGREALSGGQRGKVEPREKCSRSAAEPQRSLGTMHNAQSTVQNRKCRVQSGKSVQSTVDGL